MNVFIVLGSGDQKQQFWENFDLFFLGGGSRTDPLSPMRAKLGVLQQSHGIRLCAKFRLYRFILSPSVGDKNTIFAVFWTSAFSGVANWQKPEKVEHVCTTTNLPLSNGTKTVSVLQHLHGEIGRTISDVQKRDGQTDRQTDKKLNVFGRPGGG